MVLQLCTCKSVRNYLHMILSQRWRGFSSKYFYFCLSTPKYSKRYGPTENIQYDTGGTLNQTYNLKCTILKTGLIDIRMILFLQIALSIFNVSNSFLLRSLVEYFHCINMSGVYLLQTSKYFILNISAIKNMNRIVSKGINVVISLSSLLSLW